MAPSLRNRKPLKQAETGSDTDAGDDTLDEHSAASAPAAKGAAHSKGEGKLQKVVKRLFFGTLLLVTLCVIVASGHLATLALVQVVQIMMFRELVNVRYSARKFADVPLFRTMQWGWFYTCMLYSYGHAVNTNARLYSLIASPTIAALLSYVEIVCMGLYSVLLVTTVLSLTKGYYKYQMGQLAWTMAICLITVGQVTSFMQNIFNGLFWFLFPVALVICNDSCAYFCGMAFGRKFTKRIFLALSPNKTWEGFVGGGVCTVIFAFILPLAFVRMKFLICPAEHISMDYPGSLVFGMDCKPPLVFVPVPYALPRPVATLVGVDQLTLLPIQLHALALGLFASVVAPFGGFFASGIKRAYGLNDFAALIPGHGGVFDRVDCQLIMGLAMQIYHSTFIGTGAISLARVMTLAWQLSTEDQLDMYNQFSAHLKQHGHIE